MKEEVYKDLQSFLDILILLRETASKNYFYDRIDEWSDAVYMYLHKMLNRYGFINGNVEANKKNEEASYWWKVYGKVSDVIFSKYLKTNTAPHHSSAFERNEALILELQDLLREGEIHE